MKKIILPLIFLLFCLTVLFLGITAISSYELNQMTHLASSEEVIYIPGWKNQGVSQHEQISILRKIFPDGKFSVAEWDSEGQFDECLRRADQYARHLAEKISNFPIKRQKNLILVGHSLGGRIVIRTMALLAKRGVFIRRGIFLGVAIPDDDPDIALAIRASTQPNINIYNREDYTLRHVYGTVGENLDNAWGAYGYAIPFSHCYLLQLPVNGIHGEGERSERASRSYKEKLENHFSVFYLDFLSTVFSGYIENERYDVGRLNGPSKFL